MKVLIVNAGSSSLKYQLVNMDNEDVMRAFEFSVRAAYLQHTHRLF